jgi:hypothetical protein
MDDIKNETPDAAPLSDWVSIDLASELKKISESSVQGSWQLPAELCRRAFAKGASQVQVQIDRKGFSLRWQDAPLNQDLRQRLALLMDETREPMARHRALMELEQDGEIAWVGLAGSQPEALILEGNAMRATLRHFDFRRARNWVQNAGGYARLFGHDLSVNGEPPGEPNAPLLARQMDPAVGLAGRVSLAKNAESGHIALVSHGVVVAHLSGRAPPFFDAVVEVTDPGSLQPVQPDQARARLRQHLPDIQEQFMRLLMEGLSEPDALDEPLRAQLTTSALESTRHLGRGSGLASLPFLRAVQHDGSMGRQRWDWRSVDEMRDLAAGGRVKIQVIEPNEPVERYLLGLGPTLILDDVARALVSELLNMELINPPRRKSTLSAVLVFRRWRRSFLEGVRLLRRPLGARPLAPDELSPAQGGLVQALCSLDGGGERSAYFVAGAGPIRRMRNGITALPRGNATVKDCVAAHAKNPAWLYPVAMTLLRWPPLEAGPLTRARQRWLNRNHSMPTP